MRELDVTWQRTRSVWWLLVWRAALGAAVLGGIIGFLIGFIGAIARVPLEWIGVMSGIGGILVGLTWGFIVVRMALRKQYKEFRIALVARTG